MRLLKRLHQWDVLRANKAPFAWGVETRVPFLDKAFLDLVMNIDPQEKMVRCCRKKSPRTLRFCTEHRIKHQSCSSVQATKCAHSICAGQLILAVT